MFKTDLIQIQVQGQGPKHPSMLEVNARKKCQRTFVQAVKIHIKVRRVPRENSSWLKVKDVVLLGQHDFVLTLI